MRRRITALLLIFTIILAFSGGILAPAVSSHAGSTIIIAYTEDTNIIQYENGIFSGYGVEFFDEISLYAKWHYKLLPCSKSDALHGLDNGTIDLYLGTSDTDLLNNEYPISEHSIMNISSLIYVRPDDDRIYYDDRKALDGLTIGFKGTNTLSGRFADFAKTAGFTYAVRYYSTYEKLHNALMNGEIDAASTATLTSFTDCKLVANYGSGGYYVLGSNKHPDIMSAFNEAYDLIATRTPAFFKNLNDKYYESRPISASPLYTREEIEYISTHQNYNVGMFASSIPLAYLDSAGDFCGIFPHLLDKISRLSGINFNPVVLDTSLSPQSQLSIDIPLIFGVGLPAEELSGESIRYTLPICNFNNILISNSNKSIDFANSTAIIPKSHSNIYDYLADHYPDLRITYCDHLTDALEAVFNEKADFTIGNEYVLNYYTKSAKYAKFFCDSTFEYDEQYLFIASDNVDSELISILDKTIAFIKRTSIKDDIKEVCENIQYKPTLFDILHTYSSQIIAIICLLSFIFLLIFLEIKDRSLYKSEEKKASEYKRKSEFDSLTGLSTTEFFKNQLKGFLEVSTSGNYSLAAININNSDLITDLYGYEEYEKLVCYISKLIRNKLPELFGFACKIDFSTFLAILPSTSDPNELFGKDFVAEVNKYDLGNNVDVLVGVYNIIDTSLPVESIIKRVLSTIDLLKNGNVTSNYAVFSTNQETLLSQKHLILTNIERTLANKEFSFNIQPKIDLETEKLVGGEALIRWTIPNEGAISPRLFIPILEENGYIPRLDLYLLTEVCRLLRGYLDKELSIVPISINLSGCDFKDPMFTERIIETCNSFNIDHKYIEFEISENVYNENNRYMYAMVNNLRKENFKITMDDFGSVYSTVNMLKIAEIDNLKVDVRFIYKSDIHNRADAIIRKMSELATELNLNFVAEGVETHEQSEFLKEIGCTIAQGFYYSMPLKLTDFESYMCKNI
ncbi:MAG: EAL domain-containing protein [Lachnospiraceae bacterium]|nr:EAL domain-containing protein [Lachnospiraceae bacterium]